MKKNISPLAENAVKWIMRCIFLTYVVLSLSVYGLGLLWLAATGGAKALFSLPLIILFVLYMATVIGLFSLKNYGRFFYLAFIGYNIVMYFYRRFKSAFEGGGFVGWDYEWWQTCHDLRNSIFVVSSVILLTVLLFLTPVKNFFKK